MAAGGAYNRNSRVQAVGLMPGVDLLAQAAAAVELPDLPQPVVVADYGCSAAIHAVGAFPSLATGLDSGPDDPRTATVFERLESEIAARLASAPDRMRIPLANVVLVKQQGGG